MRTSLQWNIYACGECNLELVLLILDSLCAQVGRVAHNIGNSGNLFFYLRPLLNLFGFGADSFS